MEKQADFTTYGVFTSANNAGTIHNGSTFTLTFKTKLDGTDSNASPTIGQFNDTVLDFSLVTNGVLLFSGHTGALQVVDGASTDSWKLTILPSDITFTSDPTMLSRLVNFNFIARSPGNNTTITDSNDIKAAMEAASGPFPKLESQSIAMSLIGGGAGGFSSGTNVDFVPTPGALALVLAAAVAYASKRPSREGRKNPAPSEPTSTPDLSL